jgi:hypothetical protein
MSRCWMVLMLAWNLLLYTFHMTTIWHILVYIICIHWTLPPSLFNQKEMYERHYGGDDIFAIQK